MPGCTGYLWTLSPTSVLKARQQFFSTLGTSSDAPPGQTEGAAGLCHRPNHYGDPRPEYMRAMCEGHCLVGYLGSA